MKLFYICVMYCKKISKSPLLFLLFLSFLSRCLHDATVTKGSPHSLFSGLPTITWLLNPTTQRRLTTPHLPPKHRHPWCPVSQLLLRLQLRHQLGRPKMWRWRPKTTRKPKMLKLEVVLFDCLVYVMFKLSCIIENEACPSF
ncbi:hypothetical protein E1A91_D01G256200v1 [Gossypium mustelinum]|uniref:Secreted protein n=1 Tax=Gossypium mustelinum TaxID=34275 RepID=A0A5D2WBZ5_GOSMU|nr:hypothetical protein E1A91_D01G256200v1 [Gossypium mustelinum]